MRPHGSPRAPFCPSPGSRSTIPAADLTPCARGHRALRRHRHQLDHRGPHRRGPDRRRLRGGGRLLALVGNGPGVRRSVRHRDAFTRRWRNWPRPGRGRGLHREPQLPARRAVDRDAPRRKARPDREADGRQRARGRGDGGSSRRDRPGPDGGLHLPVGAECGGHPRGCPRGGHAAARRARQGPVLLALRQAQGRRAAQRVQPGVRRRVADGPGRLRRGAVTAAVRRPELRPRDRVPPAHRSRRAGHDPAGLRRLRGGLPALQDRAGRGRLGDHRRGGGGALR